MKNAIKGLAFVGLVIGLVASGVVLAQAADTITQRWVASGKLIGTFGVENGDTITVSASGYFVTFNYVPLDRRQELVTEMRQWDLLTAPDRFTVQACGQYVHVLAEWDTWHTIYSMVWKIPIEYHLQFLPLVCSSNH